MTRRQLEQIRPWAEPPRQPISIGWHPPDGLVRAGLLRHVVDDFYELTEKGERELEALRTGGPK